MENASKALVMAGGVLVAILIIGALTFLFRDITSVEKEKEESKKVEQVNSFNKQYNAYEKELYGHELLSLYNKMESYNKKVTDDKSGYKRLQIKIKSDVATGLYIPGVTSNPFKKMIEAKNLPGNLGISEEDFKYLADLWFDAQYSSRVQVQLEQLLSKLGKDKTNFKDSDIKAYSNYIEFKRKKFKYVGTDYDEKTGRIMRMSYEQK